jgi:hypothetical protein
LPILQRISDLALKIEALRGLLADGTDGSEGDA